MTPTLPTSAPVVAALADTAQKSAETAAAVQNLVHDTEVGNHSRDRMLSALTLLFAGGLTLGAPFALSAGESFFLPVVAAIVIGVILVPLVEWFRRRGLGAGTASVLSVLTFAVVLNLAVVSVVVPAVSWLQLLPARVEQIRHNLEPLLNTYSVVRKLMRQATRSLGGEDQIANIAGQLPGMVLGFASAAPLALFQLLFTLLLTLFFLIAYSERRDATLATPSRPRRLSQLALIGRDVVRATAAYFFTIARVNLLLGVLVAGVAWAYGLPSPPMWGGLAALANFIPYLGPVVVAALLLLGGLLTFADPLNALWPALIFVGLHLTEANVLTPALIGRRLTVAPLAVLLSLSFWGWVWGAPGALISVPLLIMGKVFLDHSGTPDILGFLFNEGTLVKSSAGEALRAAGVAANAEASSDAERAADNASGASAAAAELRAEAA